MYAPDLNTHMGRERERSEPSDSFRSSEEQHPTIYTPHTHTYILTLVLCIPHNFCRFFHSLLPYCISPYSRPPSFFLSLLTLTLLLQSHSSLPARLSCCSGHEKSILFWRTFHWCKGLSATSSSSSSSSHWPSADQWKSHWTSAVDMHEVT